MQLLLESALCAQEPALISWQSYLKKNDLQTIDSSEISLLPLVYHNLKEQSHPLCKSAYRHTWVTNQTLWWKILPTLNKLLDAGINKIALLKGMAMILHHYRNFGVRTIGDIDILIARSDVPLAYTLLTNCSWQCQVPRFNPQCPNQLSRWHAAGFKHPDGLNLDLHWSFLLESNPAVDQDVLDAIEPGIQPISPTDLFFQTCIHGNKKSTAPLIRWVPDTITILKSPINFSRLFALAQKTHLTLPLSKAVYYLNTNFNLSIPTPKIKPSRFEVREFQANLRGQIYLAGYYRARINSKTLLHYLQHTANLSSIWLVFPYAPYWLLKRLYRLLKRV